LKKIPRSKWFLTGSILLVIGGGFTVLGEYMSSHQFFKAESLLGESIGIGIAVIGFIGLLIYGISSCTHEKIIVNSHSTDHNPTYHSQN
jgi:polyferredoxin